MKWPKYIIAACSILGCGMHLYAQQGSHSLWYSKPAVNFNEALPVGNGFLGAMVYGGVTHEFISLNHSTLWSGDPDIRWNNPAAKNYLPLVRAAALQGRYREADSLCRFMQGPYTESYLPMANLRIDYERMENVSAYRRSLSLDSAMTTTEFVSGQNHFYRTVFSSFPDSVLVIRNESAKKAALSLAIHVNSLLRFKTQYEDHQMLLKGKAPSHVEPSYLWTIKGDSAIQYSETGSTGMSFAVCLKVLNEGGSVYSDDSTIHVSGADAVTILITAATSFNGYDRSPVTEGKDAVLLARNNLAKASLVEYPELVKHHLDDYQSLFYRVQLDFGHDANSELSTDERLRRMPGNFDPDLLALICQYGRYLLISSSRPGGQPSNLKGIWNEKVRPEYSSNWCIDHDAQMSYYPVETTNLSELHLPFLTLIKELSANGYQTAAINYGMQGWVAHHNTDIWRKSSPVGKWGGGNPHWANWNMSGPWLCEHFFEHFQFTQDTSFLEGEALPLMIGSARFILNWLIPDSTGTQLLSVPSFSPENTFITASGDTAQTSVNATSDIELIRDLFNNLLQASRIVPVNSTFIDSIRHALSLLPPYPIGANGNLLEWSKDWRSTDPGHRHLSHLFAVFPGSEISPLKTPLLAGAAKRALTLRTKTNGSWGFAWKAACWARLFEADSAMETLRYQLNYVEPTATEHALGLYPNLFNSEVPGVILNGNMCITAAVTEMLLQSQTGAIQFLPALPKELPAGNVSGLLARGGFTVGLHWDNGQLSAASINARINSSCRIFLPKGYHVYYNTHRVRLKRIAGQLYSFYAEKNKSYIVKR